MDPSVKEERDRMRANANSGERKVTKIFRTPVAKVRLLTLWDSEEISIARPQEREA